MNESAASNNIVTIDTSVPIWEQFFTVAPLVLIGTTDMMARRTSHQSTW